MRDCRTISLDEVEAMNLAIGEILARQSCEEVDSIPVPVADILMFAEMLPGPRMLDAGCGWGRYVHRFLELGLDYRGIDISPLMVNEARRRNPGQEFRVESVRGISYPDASFDGIWSCCVMDHEPKRNIQTVLREKWRVLRQSGILCTVTPSPQMSDEYVAERNDGGGYLYFAHWKLDEWSDALRSAGFSVIDAFERYECGSMTHIAMRR